MEQDGFVDAVEELGAEMCLSISLTAASTSHSGASLHASFWISWRADVAGHDDDGVLEIHGAALAVGEPAVVEDLKQHVEHIAMGLFDFVEQDDE